MNYEKMLIGRTYWLDDAHNVHPCMCLDDLRKTISTPRIGLDQVGDSEVSTVFLSNDHNHSGIGPPVVFETLVFGGPLDGEMERYTSWSDAEAGHRRMVEKVWAKRKIGT